MSSTIVMLTGLRMPAHRPCAVRATIKKPRLGANAAANDATLKAASAERNTGFAPRRFAIQPAAGIVAHTARRLAVSTHWMFCPASSDLPICGSAMPTTV